MEVNIGKTKNTSLTKILGDTSCFLAILISLLSLQFLEGKRLLSAAKLRWGLR